MFPSISSVLLDFPASHVQLYTGCLKYNDSNNNSSIYDMFFHMLRSQFCCLIYKSPCFSLHSPYFLLSLRCFLGRPPLPPRRRAPRRRNGRCGGADAVAGGHEDLLRAVVQRRQRCGDLGQGGEWRWNLDEAGESLSHMLHVWHIYLHLDDF